MQDQKKSSSIFSFSETQLRFLKYCGIFFIPIVIAYIILEVAVDKIPTNYAAIGKDLSEHGANKEVAVFGSSQVMNSVNPEFIDKPSINFSSTSQHHNLDFEILKQTKDRLTNLDIVIFEVSFGHFEIPHNSRYFWKNSVYLKYYDVNTFQRETYYKDKFLLMSRPGFFSRLLITHYIFKKDRYNNNKFGFNKVDYRGKFKGLDYDTTAIMKSRVSPNTRIHKAFFNYNVSYFYNMLDYCEENGLKVLIISTPTYANYRNKRYPDVVKRRDSILKLIKQKYSNVYFLNAESDPTFTAKYFKNENHLNPDGAEKFSKQLNKLLDSID